ncbi:hypothetical protein ACFV8Z_29965 [Streptomyces sp. NPDC059837]|uniref:hypothetical protein n=1 Tax=Streptomyces sp. NPDC059837 TaxID=3346968 RepID=UPI00364EC333
MAGPRLADVTARWKSASPQNRLRRRNTLLGVADDLKAAAAAFDPALARALDRARAIAIALGHVVPLILNPDLDFDLARTVARALNGAPTLGLDPDFELDFDPDLTRDRALARALIRDLAHDIDPDLARARVRDLARALARAHARAHAIALDPTATRAREDILDPARDFDRDHAIDHARALGLDLDRDYAIDLARALARALDFDLDRDLELAGFLARAVALISALDRDHAPARALNLLEAHDNLTDAANNFIGADLTTVDPVAVDLAGIRWGSDTQWPTPEWTARIHRASVESPPGSGVFIVLPEEGHNFANHNSLAPIS